MPIHTYMRADLPGTGACVLAVNINPSWMNVTLMLLLWLLLAALLQVLLLLLLLVLFSWFCCCCFNAKHKQWKAGSLTGCCCCCCFYCAVWRWSLLSSTLLLLSSFIRMEPWIIKSSFWLPTTSLYAHNHNLYTAAALTHVSARNGRRLHFCCVRVSN